MTFKSKVKIEENENSIPDKYKRNSFKLEV
jgi:hypothetical protein